MAFRNDVAAQTLGKAIDALVDDWSMLDAGLQGEIVALIRKHGPIIGDFRIRLLAERVQPDHRPVGRTLAASAAAAGTCGPGIAGGPGDRCIGTAAWRPSPTRIAKPC